MAEHNTFGKWGEMVAEDYLREKGYRILARDWRDLGKRDLDIVAMDGDTLVFVEVKARAMNCLVEPEQAITLQKMYNITNAAMAYINYHRLNNPYRFDVIAIKGSPQTGYTLNHIDEAFDPVQLTRRPYKKKRRRH